ncbi:MAG TPA: peptidoglycan DD-metalloendopeptidase family protein, partial [Polyangia bacterium]|nr:peptidoglycan DD-metalloendopeptidase family protein [Polyangia bacterium]
MTRVLLRSLAALLLVGVAGAAFGGRPPEAVDADRSNAEAEVHDLERRERALQDQQAERRQQLKQRLRALYKLANGGYVRLVVGAETVEQLDARRAAAGRVVARDLAELRAIRVEEQELEVEQARRKDALARALDFGAQVALADVAEPSGLQRRQGQLPRPVMGPVVSAFGPHKDAQTGLMLARRGVELRSHAGELVRAIASGRVRFVGEVPGLGRGVAIDHGGGYVTLTAELGELRCNVGDEVGDGDVIALAGAGTVYFEL